MADKTVGYLAGCRADPLTDARLVDHNYYQFFRDVLPAYPAHLHVNVGEAYRSAGIGAALIEVFAAQCAAEGLSGLHVVTGHGARNLPFYHRAGFIHDVRPHGPNSGQLFLGRRLPADQR